MGCEAANKEELLEMITHGAENIVNSTEACVSSPSTLTTLRDSEHFFVVSKLTTTSTQLSNVAKSVQQN